jgi:hypothetical protein
MFRNLNLLKLGPKDEREKHVPFTGIKNNHKRGALSSFIHGLADLQCFFVLLRQNLETKKERKVTNSVRAL